MRKEVNKMDKLDIVLKALFQSIKISVEAFTLPTGKHLIPAFLTSLGILVITIICQIFGWFTVIKVPGALLGVLVLLGIIIIERNERSEVSNFYRAVATGIKNVTNRQTSTTTDESVEVNESDTESCTGGSGVGHESAPSSPVCAVDEGSSGTAGGSVSAECQDSDDRDLD